MSATEGGRLRVLVPRHSIEVRTAQVAAAIDADYAGKAPVLLGVLKGAFVFLADLARCMAEPVQLDFVEVSSYGKGKRTSGRPRMIRAPGLPLGDRHVLIVEDIVDSGVTVDYLIDYIARLQPASVRVCALFDKPCRREVEVPLHYVGFTIPDVFAVGCGLDYAEEYRNLPDLCALEEA